MKFNQWRHPAIDFSARLLVAVKRRLYRLPLLLALLRILCLIGIVHHLSMRFVVFAIIRRLCIETSQLHVHLQCARPPRSDRRLSKHRC